MARAKKPKEKAIIVEEVQKPIQEEVQEVKTIELPEENPDEKDVTLNESESLQKQGWRVFAIYVENNQTRHKLKRVSEG